MKKLLLVLVSICTIFSTSPLVYADEDPENKEFTEFLNQEFIDTMESDYMTMHYGVKDYASYGIEKPERTLGDASYDSYSEAVSDAKETLNKLTSFDYDSLSINQQHDYDVYKKALEDTIALNSYPLFDSLFNPNTGILDNIITNFTEFTFYEKEDIQDYLDTLSTVSDYLEEALETTKTQASYGYFLSDTLLDETESWISDFVAKKEDSALIQVFNENIDAFDGLTDSEKEEYKEKNKDIVLNSVIPAYENVSTVLETLRGSSKYEGGLYNYPNGKEYYQYLVYYKTSTTDSIETLVSECENYINDLVDLYITIYYMDENIEEEVSNADYSIGSAEEVLEYLKNNMSEYPSGPSVSYICSYLDESVANDSVLAYYLSPTLDDYSNNVIRVNGETVGDDAEQLYGTLAHEGFPGHLYQTTWYYATSPNPLRTVISQIGYTEGWAMYAECDEYLNSNESYAVSMYSLYNTALNYIVSCYADLGVNGLGWNADTLDQKFQDIGLVSGLGEAFYEDVISRPGQLLPYGIGMMKFHELRGKASTALGDKFNETTFDSVLLTYGPRPFEVVEKDVDEYITLKGGTVTDDYNTFYDYESALVKNLSTNTSDPNYINAEVPKDNSTNWKVIATGGGIVILIAVVGVIIYSKRKKA